jgi:hypothetical protein
MSVNLEERGHLDKADCKNIGDFCPDGNKISDPIEGEEFLERLSDSQLPEDCLIFMVMVGSVCCLK